MLVRQFSVTGALYTCRPDLVGFINGLPRVVVELKKPDVPARAAFDENLTHYKQQIPALFWFNALLVASNGMESRVGSLTAEWERFFEWKRIERENEPGPVSLEVIVRNSTDSWTYISTVATDFLSVDFTAVLTYTVAGSGGDPSVFFGVGSGQPDANFYGEPISAVYMRSGPADFGSGQVEITLNDGAGNVNAGSALGYPGNGTSRVKIVKVGDSLTFEFDPNSSSGTFVSAFSQSFSVSSDLSFLNDTNSSIFFGASTASVLNNVTVTVTDTPEPSALALLALGGFVVAQISRFPRRQA